MTFQLLSFLSISLFLSSVFAQNENKSLKPISRFMIDKKEEGAKSLFTRYFAKDFKVQRHLQIAKNRFMGKKLKKKLENQLKQIEVPNETLGAGVLHLETTLNIPENNNLKRDPAVVYLPRDYKKRGPLPLVVSLHGYSGGQWIQNFFFPFKNWINDMGYILVLPSGVKDKHGNQFWNAMNACCNWYFSKVDDLGYLKKLISILKRKYNISNTVVAGHSNGGFMAHRMACDGSEFLDGIISWGGSNYPKKLDCIPKRPVNILHLHGDEDTTIPFDGVANLIPSAPKVVKDWSNRMNCENAINDGRSFIKSTKWASIYSKEVLLMGWENCQGNKKAVLGVIPEGTHAGPIDNRLFKKLLKSALFNDFNF